MTPPAWLFDERAHAGHEHLDPASVSIYDEKARSDPTDDLTLLRRLSLDGSSTLVDLGAGTGSFALAAASVCRKVVAVDISQAMISTLKDRTRELALANVEIVEAGFLTYEHEGEPADFVYCRNALHHLPDVWKAVALQRAAALLRPGGVLRLRDLVYSFDPAEAGRVLSDWLDRATDRPEDGWTRSELEAHIRDEYSTFDWLLEPMLERAGFEVLESRYTDGVYAQFVCTTAGSG